MKTYSPQRHRGTEKNKTEQARTTQLHAGLLFSVSLCLCGSGFAAPSTPDLPGRLFYTPEQRAQLEAARARSATQTGPRSQTPDNDALAPLRYDGVVIRSDGKTTRWVDGKPQPDASAVSGLRPGQIRADGKVYEPYQVLRPLPPSPAKPGMKESP